ncbi:ethanolamine ammonia-lyase subunit EutC [Kineosporia rhizophila]|uniref:ethanolamine ammonia-lyase subunit EutC n=1 Tax=Kineosporia TaxID=49184 RepID=UPI001E579B35|nr:ethanolamine ammonia-lyase subunit EutC [Kineosporia sp. NBRC 101677]MCE0540283.1 ethanolamine ammonia-lyase subunit EutC [Kineosporia rhizophila]GLY16255.1 ethanolamine ammonia-lyase light chain [Kineosporia sp. NBRC 101677]
MTDFWDELRATTQARIGLGRVGDGMPTSRVLEFRLAHAIARDAVHDPLDVDALLEALADAGVGGSSAEEPHSRLGPAVVVTSQAADRAEYLRRPDLGRLPADLSGVPAAAADVGFVLADGLSARALQTHGPALLAALVEVLPPTLTLAPPVIATQARVGLGDHIGAALGVQTVLVLIGERPGLSVADSLGIYLTHRPRPGLADSDRNCVSNIHAPGGLPYAAAARVVSGLIAGARQLGRSGVALKDTSREIETAKVDPALS